MCNDFSLFISIFFFCFICVLFSSHVLFFFSDSLQRL